jgi:5-methylcytosine-specific restriction protein A
MARANKVCSTSSCPEIVPAGTSRCPRCDTAADRARGTAAERGYNSRGHRNFRTQVLTKNPLCVCTDRTKTAGHNHGRACGAVSTVADHYPRSRKELQALGLNADDPAFGRGLCKRCHDYHSSQAQPGGWNTR